MAYKPVEYKPVEVYQPGQTIDNFKNQATNQYTPLYNEKVASLRANLAKTLASLEGQKSGVNNIYNNQISNQNMANTRSKNNYSNTSLGRGLGRSSIVTSGLGEYDLANDRINNETEGMRSSALSNIDAQKVATETGVNDQITTMGNDLQSQIMALAQSLYDNYQKNLFNQSAYNSDNQLGTDKFNVSSQLDSDKFDYGKTQDIREQSNWQKEFDANEKYRQAQLKMAQQELAAKLSSSGGGSSSGGTYGNGSKASKTYAGDVDKINYVLSSTAYEPQQKIAILEEAYNNFLGELSPESEKIAGWIKGEIARLKQGGFASKGASAIKALSGKASSTKGGGGKSFGTTTTNKAPVKTNQPDKKSSTKQNLMDALKIALTQII